MKSNQFTTVMAILALGVSAAAAPTSADAKPFGFGGPHHFHHGGFGVRRRPSGRCRSRRRGG